PVVRLRRSIAASVITVRPLLFDPSAQSGVVRLQVDVSGFGIGRHSTPVRTAISREDDRASRRSALFMEKKRCERTGVIKASRFFVDLYAGFRMFGCLVFRRYDVFFLETRTSERRRFERERLRRRIPFARRVACGNRPFLDAEDWFSRVAVQDEHPRLLVD